ncbi:unnamed protein product [Parajaminaea phylloscopi]
MPLEIPHFKLNTGAKVPAVGLGVWLGKPGAEDINHRHVEDAIEIALEKGYRHIDTARLYDNETQVGNAIRSSKVPREQIFVTTKLANSERLDPHGALKRSLDRLNIGYIDAYLMHWPQGQNPETGEAFGLPGQPGPTFNDTWAEMEKMLADGKVKAIGVSNFSITNLKSLLSTAKVTPAINQIEGHPYHPDEELVAFCESKGIHVTYYSPIGQPAKRTDIIKDAELVKLGEETGSSAAQVALAWAVQKGRSVVPKSARAERIEGNLRLPKLTAEQLARVDAIHANDPKKHTRLNIGAPDAKEKMVFGWTLDQLDWPIGFLPIAMPGRDNTVESIP